jgi:Phage tail tube protein
MAQRIAGTAFVMVDGNQYALKGNLIISPSVVERTMIAGQDSIHGYQELPRVPWVSGDFSTIPELSLEDLVLQTDVTVVIQCANRRQYTFSQATCKGNFEANTRDGQLNVRWEAMFCEELTL